MSDLKKLFDYRLDKYKQTTEKILQTIPNVMEGVLGALAEDESSTLEWEDIQFEPDEDLLILIGFIQLKIGERVKLESGREIHVTDENVEKFRRIVRVGIPLDLAENGSVEEVSKFFEGKRQTNYTTLDDIAEDLDELEDIDEFENLEDLHRQAVTSIIGFDTEDLTDEQIRQIIDNNDEGKIH